MNHFVLVRTKKIGSGPFLYKMDLISQDGGLGIERIGGNPMIIGPGAQFFDLVQILCFSSNSLI